METHQKVHHVISQSKSTCYCFYLTIFSLAVTQTNIFLFISPVRKKKFVFNFVVSVGKQSHDKKDKQEPHTWQQWRILLSDITQLADTFFFNGLAAAWLIYVCFACLSTKQTDVNRKWWGKSIQGKHIFFKAVTGRDRKPRKILDRYSTL